MNYFEVTDFETTNGWIVLLIIGLVLFCITFIISLPVILMTALARRSANRFLKERESTVIALYEPPLGLAPAELGMLYGLRCDDKELQATLFDLNRRNIISLSHARAAIVASQEVYDNLEEFEKIAINTALMSDSIVKETRSLPVTVFVEGREPQVMNFSLQ